MGGWISEGEKEMGWAEQKVEQYNQGQKATWLELRVIEHANPVHLILAIVGVIAFIYGLWAHDWVWIFAGILADAAGHAYCWLQK